MARLSSSPLLLPDVLREAHEGDRLHAGKLAELLDWGLEDIGAYLGVSKSALYHNPVSIKHQDKLARLSALFAHAHRLMNGELGLVRTWLRSPVPVLERATPKSLVLKGEIARVESLLDEVASGFAA